MKLQLAIDRVSLGKAIETVILLQDYVDIIEIGTSLIKDYGMLAVREIKTIVKSASLLADMKIMDEAAYEMKAAYENGADIVTVMGASSLATIDICGQIAIEQGKEYMIDLMEVSEEKIKILAQKKNAILCYHLPTDRTDNMDDYLDCLMDKDISIAKTAIAGGIDLNTITKVKSAGFEIAVIGSGITKSHDMIKAVKRFKELL